MTADFTKPDLTDLHTAIWPQVRDNIDAVAKCFSGSTPATNIPTDAKRFDSGKWQTWNGSAWVDTLIAVSGGGTGANSSSGARAALDVYSKGDTDGKYLAKASNLLDVANAATARQNIGAHDASNLTTGTVSSARLPSASTSAQGVVQLNNTTSSTSTTQAATANAVKTAYDKIYFNSDVLDFVDAVPGASPFSNGSLKVCRVGDVVTITILAGNSGGVLITPDSSALLDQILPSWARPVQATKSLYEWSGNPRMINASTNGTVSFIFYNWSGALVSSGVTGLTSISYIGAAL